jgi:hypothetical protein
VLGRNDRQSLASGTRRANSVDITLVNLLTPKDPRRSKAPDRAELPVSGQPSS